MRRLLPTLMLVALAACAVTERAPEKTVRESGFLHDYSDLRPGGKDQASLIYINPNAKWSQYTGILLEPVTFWADPNANVDPKVQQELISYYYNVLKQDLSTQLPIVDLPGPGVIRFQAALTDASSATPVLRSVSVVVPQARLLGVVKNYATGSYAFVGSAQSETLVTDSVTGERLAASVDRRTGGLSLKNAAVWQWGDTENAMSYWAQKASQRLGELRSGVAQTSSR